MIDLHFHILHDFDDGAQNLEMAVDLARVAFTDGTRVIVATPHGPAVNARYSLPRYYDRLNALRHALATANIGIEIVEGTELYATPDLPTQLRRGDVLTYNGGRTILLEFYLPSSFDEMAQLIAPLHDMNYRVLVAHPERMAAVQENPEGLRPFHERGILFQLTADAVSGLSGTYLQQISHTLLQHNLADVIATDAHGPHHNRMPALRRAWQTVAERFGEIRANQLCMDTPAELLQHG